MKCNEEQKEQSFDPRLETFSQEIERLQEMMSVVRQFPVEYRDEMISTRGSEIVISRA